MSLISILIHLGNREQIHISLLKGQIKKKKKPLLFLEGGGFLTTSIHQRPLPPCSPTYHVHDGEDIGLHILAPMVLDHLRVGHHQRLHPPLFADGTPGEASAWQVVSLPFLSL